MNWFGHNLWAAWILAAVVLAGVEMLTLDFTLLMLAIGAMAGGLTALALPTLWPVQLLVALVVSVLALAVVRPTLLAKIRDMPGYRSAISNVIGETGVAVKEITSEAGEVRINSETWSARSGTSEPINEGQKVQIERIEGVTAYVVPVHRTTE